MTRCMAPARQRRAVQGPRVRFARDRSSHSPHGNPTSLSNFCRASQAEALAPPVWGPLAGGRADLARRRAIGHEVAAFKIPLPDMESQEKIAWAIQNLERKKELHEQKRTFLQDIFRTLLHELMTAKTRVHELDLPAGESAA